MENIEILVEGAPVVYSNMPPTPYNPLRRPKVYLRKMLLALSIFILSITGLAICGSLWFRSAALWVCIGWAILYLLVIGKRALIWMVHLYQNKASDRTRLKCVFEPSCSEYMILSLEKYGLIRGTWKGIRRLLRCKLPNGGIDYP